MGTIDIVYKVGAKAADREDPALRDWELRYSLRSVAQNAGGAGRIWIIGHCPEWLKPLPGVIDHIPVADPYRANKDANLTNKLIRAAMDPRVSGRFVFQSDDQLWLKPQPAERACRCPVYLWDAAGMDAEDWAAKEKETRWYGRLRRTVDALRDAGLPTLNFETHTPQIVAKEWAARLLDWDFGADVGYCVHTLLYNSLSGIDVISSANGYQVWAEAATTPEEIALRMGSGAWFLTLSNGATKNSALLHMIEQRFPTPAAWERETPEREAAAVELETFRHRAAALGAICQR